MNNQIATILIIDDVVDNLLLISSLLEDTYYVKTADNSKKGLSIANANPHPDLILLDVMMPYIDGYEICRQLKANPATWNIPIIFLTAAYYRENEQKGMALGAAAYLVKPIHPPILRGMVHTHLASFRGETAPHFVTA